MSGDRRPRVSVILVTYNHERYIEQALDSVLGQRTDFPVEVLIAEDFSTDSTRDIVRAYRDRYPDRIRLLLSHRNLNDNSIVSRALEAARGEYVALLDGDDWWTSTEKLARQVRILDAEPDVSISFHNVDVMYESAAIAPHPFHVERPTHRLSAPLPRPYTGLADMVGGNYIQTCSVVFRSSALPPLPSWYRDLPVGDWPLYVLLAERGRIAYLDEVLAAYRVHAHGLWSEGLSRNQDVDGIGSLLRTCDVLDRHLEGKYHELITRGSAYLHRQAAVVLCRQGDLGGALGHWRAYGRAGGTSAALTDRALWVNVVRAVTRLEKNGSGLRGSLRRSSQSPSRDVPASAAVPEGQTRDVEPA
jgi:glycosyltransferase involved in cell wall biosynthesis